MKVCPKSCWRWVCWFIIAFALLARTREFFALDKFAWNTGTLIAPPSGATTPSGEPEWWTFELCTTWVLFMNSNISVGIDSYDSMGTDGDALAAQWQSTLGYAYTSYPMNDVSVPRTWFAWDRPTRMIILGAGYETALRQGIETHLIVIPLWMIVLAASVPLFISHRRRRTLTQRLRRGWCTQCGYDRSSVPAVLPCPECGREK